MTIRAGQTHEAQAGTITVLRMGPGLNDLLHHLGGGGVDGASPLDKPRWRPLHMGAAGGGHVGGIGDVAAAPVGWLTLLGVVFAFATRSSAKVAPERPEAA